jgi:hypothetical protein
MDKYVFVSEPLPLYSLHFRKLVWSNAPPTAANSSDFTQTVLKARELIFTFPDLLANPLADQRAVMAVGRPQLFADPKFRAKCEKLNLKGRAHKVHNFIGYERVTSKEKQFSWLSISFFSLLGLFFLSTIIITFCMQIESLGKILQCSYSAKSTPILALYGPMIDMAPYES